MVDIPHFDLPFRFNANGVVAVVEQDSLADVVNCVTAIMMTPLGTRPEIPTFGVPDLTFEKQPLQLQDLLDSVESNEPRATVVFTQAPDVMDELVANLTADVQIAKTT